METVGLGDNDTKLITHSICEKCACHQLAQTGMKVPESLQGLDDPVVAVDSDGSIMTANVKALELVGKNLSEVKGLPGGDVFECQNASLTEGCGNAVHCCGCAIRIAVVETLTTGNSLLKFGPPCRNTRPKIPKKCAC